jgi:LysR family transcriptional regulator for metE and metH
MSGVPLTEGLIELARAGLGVAVLARWAIAAHRRDRDLRILKIGRSGTWRTWSTVRLQRHPDAARVDAFTDLLREEGLRLTRGSAG